MKGKKSTRSAFLTSLMSLVLCFAMLLGTTFAWFNDTASTAVNKIQAGTLDVALEMNIGTTAAPNWVNAEGKTLTWQKADGHESEQVLWEPGCIYQLPMLRIVNKGNLALKYKLLLSGIKGNAELNNAIDWEIVLNGEDDFAFDVDHTLVGTDATDVITIQGHMKEEAGNEYQGKSIDGIGITVVATQLTAEYDSIDNTYDATATYPWGGIQPVATTDNKLTAPITIGAASVTADAPVSVTVPVGVQVKENATNFEVTVDDSVSHPNVTIGDGSTATAYKIEMPQLSSDNDIPVPVSLFVGTDRNLSEVYHDATLMTEADSRAADTYQYDPVTGVLTVYITHCSIFTCVDVPDFLVSNFTEFQAALSEAESGDLIALTADINPTTNFTFNKSVVIDMNGHGFVRAKEASGGYGIKLNPGCDLTMRNGRWDMAGTFGDISAEGKNGTCNVKYENVVFTNLDNPTKEELAAKPGNSSNLVKTAFKANMQGDFNVNATFTNCTFNNAAVEFGGFNSGNTYNATFTGCTFNNIGNACAIKAGNYGMSENCELTVTDCTFNITVTSNVSAIEVGSSVNTVKLNLTDNVFNGAKADSSFYKVFSTTSLKAYNSSQKFDVTESGTTLQGITTMN